MEEKAQRHNSGKLKWSLVHFKSLHPLVEVLMFGAKKYAPDNWKKGFDKKELLDSMARHVTALMDGEEFDSESKLHHIGHIMCNAMFYSFHFVILQKAGAIDTSNDVVIGFLPVEYRENIFNGIIEVKLICGTLFHRYNEQNYNKNIELLKKNVDRYFLYDSTSVFRYYKLKQ